MVEKPERNPDICVHGLLVLAVGVIRGGGDPAQRPPKDGDKQRERDTSGDQHDGLPHAAQHTARIAPAMRVGTASAPRTPAKTANPVMPTVFMAPSWGFWAGGLTVAHVR